MSYLNRIRLHFAGTFQAAVSTVNNDVTHYNNATFKPEYQLMQDGSHLNGWWNPRGDASFRLIGCQVTSAYQADGQAVPTDDDILTCLIGDNDRSVAAKMADLDPQQQLVSGIWGLEVRVTNSQGQTLLRGKMKAASFMDIWDRAMRGGGDLIACSFYQSVLTDLEWSDETNSSPFLSELKQVSSERLSIKFNVDGYNMDHTSPHFTLGRVVGTIGPATEQEPDFFVNGRQFIALADPNGRFFKPQGNINFCPAVVDEAAGKVLLDLGNSLPTKTPGGPLYDLGPLSFVCEVQPDDPTGAIEWLPLGEIHYRETGWYEKTAGIVELPHDRRLTQEELAQIRENPLTLLLPGSDRRMAPAITEAPGGIFVRADEFVYRLNPGERKSVRLYATRYGQPYASARVLLLDDPSQLQGGPGEPPVAVPAEALDYPARVVTGADGTATFELTGHDPKNPRGYIDGQVYGVRPVLEETVLPGLNFPINPWNFISVLLWNAFQPDEPPTWQGSIHDIFQQYANLYPVMDRFLNLGDYQAVCQNRHLLLLAFSLDPENPNSMPVTRDLSEGKRQAIERWLKEVGPDGNPLFVGKPEANAALEALVSFATDALGEMTSPSAPPTIAKSLTDPRGGKEAAMKRRLIHLMQHGILQR